MSNGIGDVELVTRWVKDDLSNSTFTDQNRKRILDDVDDLEKDLVTWNRPIQKCLKKLQTSGSETVYGRRIGNFRAFYIRRGSTMYCIGVGKRKNTYQQDLDRMEDRADRF